MRVAARWFSEVVAFAVDNVRTIVFVFGLALLAYGLSRVPVYGGAVACIVPGSLLVWLAIPPAVKGSK